MEKAFTILQKYFGYNTFKEGQAEIIEALIKKQDVIAIMPTGAGKSICYQIPGLLTKNISIVVSPLISLMKDQVTSLKQLGVYAAFLNSSLSADEQNTVLDDLKIRKHALFYLAPEQLLTPRFLEFIKEVQIDYVFIDEAHCVSQWGQDFRPSYLQIIEFIKILKKRPTIGAFTATATQNVKEDIINMLNLEQPFALTTGFDRKNLFYSVKKVDDKLQSICAYLENNRLKSGIIYCNTRKNVENLHHDLTLKRFKATRYHAGLNQLERQRNQEDFANDRAKIMVATNAFGMGIDKSNVSFVIHYNMPKNLENYYQEAGRAGRDGLAAECIIYYKSKDVITNQFFIDSLVAHDNMTHEEFEVFKKNEQERLKKMIYYCFTSECLRHYILNYFGESFANFCGNCSNCLSNFKKVDITIEAQKILSCVVRMKEKFGVKMVIDTLKGSKQERIFQLKLNEISTYNLMSDISEKELRQIIEFLMVENYLKSSGGNYPVLQLGELSKEILFERKSISMNLIKEEKLVKIPKLEDFKDEQNDLFLKLQTLRKRLANEQKVPAYIIFHDSTLKQMSAKLPQTLRELSQISGVGSMKLKQYGKQFLEIINKHMNTLS